MAARWNMCVLTGSEWLYQRAIEEEDMPTYGVANSFVVLHKLEWPSYDETYVQIADSRRCCCCLGIALKCSRWAPGYFTLMGEPAPPAARDSGAVARS